MPTYRLITLGPSHYCEKARWALERARVPFKEEPRLPLFHLLATHRARGGRTLPILVTESGAYPDSSDIIELADRHCSGALFGSGAERRVAKELEEHFDEELGPHSRRLMYFHLLDRTEVMTAAFAHGVSRAERATFRAALPALRSVLRRKLQIDSESAATSRERVQAVFREVGERLRGGRPFLTGRRFTAADLTFAALAAPVIVPPEYGWPLPDFSTLPAPFQSEARHLRDTPAGQFALRLYREERHNVPAIGE